MGCSASKLEDEEAVQLCRDRRNYIKQAVERRLQFASGHVAYIQALKRVSVALRNYVDGDDHYHGSFFSDSSMTPPFTPVKQLNLETVTTTIAHYLRPEVEPSVAVEEWPAGSPETVRVESYYTMDHYGVDGFFATEASPMHSSSFSSPYNRPRYPPPSPQTQQWDYFWNPFTSLDPYGYPSRDSLDRMRYPSRDSLDDDEITRLRQVREEEGIPELEEDEDEDEDEDEIEEVQVVKEEIPRVEVADEAPTVVNVDKEKSSTENGEKDKAPSIKEARTQGAGTVDVSEARNEVNTEVTNIEGSEATPGFTVYVNRRPTSMSEVMKDMESQFTKICDAAQEVSVMLEVSRAQYSSTSSELAAIRMLNPITLFRSASRSSSTRDLQTSSGSRDDGYESSTNSEESCMISGSHQATLERLYAWEKKLYEEVKSGERIRIAYEKKCTQLRNHDVNGEEPSVVDRTREAIRDLRTRLQVSIHAVESVSKRIETLRDQELHPQLMELMQGLSRMWRTIADCHRIQKLTIDEAKLLLFSPSSATPKPFQSTPPLRPSKHAASLESALRHWRSSLETWIDAQRSYATALAGWIARCARPQSETAARSPLSPGRTDRGAPPVYRVCLLWSRLFETVSEARAVEGVEFFAAGIGSVYAQQREGAAAPPEVRAAMPPEREAEVAAKVLCAGMAVAVGSLAEFAGGSAEGYEEIVKKCGEDELAGRVEI